MHSSAGEHFAELDGIRGLLALVVMLYHFGLNTALERASGGLLHSGEWELCVDFFFILSGLVLAKSIAKRPPSPVAYAVRRVFRLAPLFLLTTLCVAWLEPGNRPAGLVLANLLMVQSILGVESINFPGWSIPFELVFPAAFLLVPMGQRLPTRAISALLALLLASCAAATYCYTSRSVDLVPLRAVRAAIGLPLGATLFLLHDRLGGAGSARATAAAVAGLLLLMASSGAFPAIAIVFPALAVAAVWFGSRARGVFSTAPLQELGRSSYAIYLTHIPVLYAATSLLGDAGVRQPWAKLGMVGVVLLLSAAAYRVIEVPFIRIGERLARRLIPANIPATAT